MHIAHDSWDALILKERAIALRAIGLVLGVIGAVLITRSVSENGLSLAAPLIAGGGMLTLGALFAVLPATHTFAFSRSERRLVVMRRRLGRITREQYPLRDVADALVETSKSSDGDTYRIVVQLADGRTIPVTSYYSSGYEGKRRAADRMRAFLGQAGERETGAALHLQAPARNTLTSPRQRLGAMAFLALFGLGFGGIGGTIMWREHRRLTTWLPVEATVLSTRVDESSDDDGTTYSPVVVYRYYVNERPYTSSRVLPIKESRSGGWAQRIVAQYDVNATYTAWYDPADPAAAYLRRSRSLVAPIFAGVGVLLVVGALVGARRTHRA